MQEAMIVAAKKHGEYRRSIGGAYSVWIGGAVRNRMIDLWRVAGRGRAREKLVASVRSELDEVANATPSVPTARVPADFTLPFGAEKILVSRCIDAELGRQVEQIDAAEDREVVSGLQAGVFTLQRIRMQLIGQYLPMAVGTRRFSPESISICAPKPEQEE